MSIWDDFSDDELFVILECDNLKEIKKKFRRKYNRECWMNYARQYYDVERNHQLYMESFFYSINDASNYALLTLLSILGSITLEFLPLSILTGALSVVTIATCGVFLVSAYREHQQERKKTQEDLDFIALKIQCENEIIRRKKVELAASMRNSAEITAVLSQNPDIEPEPFVYKNKITLEKVRPAMGFGLLTAMMMFGTYYSGVAIIIHAFGALAISGALLGPIGIGVALGVALVIGAYCGYRHYQALVKEDRIARFQEYQKEISKDKRTECYDLLKKTSSLAHHHVCLARAHSTPDIYRNSDFFSDLKRSRRCDVQPHKIVLQENKDNKNIPHAPII